MNLRNFQVQKQCSTSTSSGRNAASVPWVLAETSDKTTKTPCNGAALPLRKLKTYPQNWSFSPDMLIFLGGHALDFLGTSGSDLANLLFCAYSWFVHVPDMFAWPNMYMCV